MRYRKLNRNQQSEVGAQQYSRSNNKNEDKMREIRQQSIAQGSDTSANASYEDKDVDLHDTHTQYYTSSRTGTVRKQDVVVCLGLLLGVILFITYQLVQQIHIINNQQNDNNRQVQSTSQISPVDQSQVGVQKVQIKQRKDTDRHYNDDDNNKSFQKFVLSGLIQNYTIIDMQTSVSKDNTTNSIQQVPNSQQTKNTIQNQANLPQIGNIQQKVQKQVKKQQKPRPVLDPQLFSDPIQINQMMRAGIPQIRRKLWMQFIKLKDMTLSSELAQLQKQYYQQKYNISKYKQLPFCIVVPSFENVQSNRYLNNINSILQQDYSNYHIVFIDDASKDGTASKITDFVFEHQISQAKMKVVLNKDRTMALPNIYKSAHQYCADYQLFMLVDGDDELIGKQVLKFFNAVFQSRDLWVAYSNFITPSGNLGFSRPYHSSIIQSSGYRKAPFTISHLRVFFTKLFTLIKQSDFKNEEGQWFRASNDVSMYIPVMEMSHTRIQYFRQICYMYNSNTGLNNHKIKFKEQRENEKIIRSRKSYAPLQKLFTDEQLQLQKINTDKKIPIKDPTKINYSIADKYAWEVQN